MLAEGSLLGYFRWNGAYYRVNPPTLLNLPISVEVQRHPSLIYEPFNSPVAPSLFPTRLVKYISASYLADCTEKYEDSLKLGGSGPEPHVNSNTCLSRPRIGA